MPRLSEGGLRLTLTNEVRGGSPPFGPTPRAPLDAPDHDPNYQRVKFYLDELQNIIENDPHVSERIQAKCEALRWVIGGWVR